MDDDKSYNGNMVTLTPSNYTIWKTLMSDLLYCKDLYDPIEEEGKRPKDIDKKTWTKINRKAVGTIRQWIGLSMMHYVMKETDAYSLWKTLENLCESKDAYNKVLTIRRLVNLKYKDGTSVTEHLNKFQEVLCQLTAMKVVLEDEVQALILLSSLPASWDTLVLSLSNSAPEGKVTTGMVKERILNEQSRRKEEGLFNFETEVHIAEKWERSKRFYSRGKNQKQASRDDRGTGKSSGQSKSRLGITCFYCEKPGHVQSECRKYGSDQEEQKGDDKKDLGFAVAKGKLKQQPCPCFIVPSLTETILDTDQTSNLKDRYVLGHGLGWGHFGITSVCTDKLTGEVLACKSIVKDRLVTSNDAKSVELEIEIMSGLSGHPNIVDLKAVYEDEDYVHLVMELCAGGELFHQLEKHGRFSEGEAKVLFRHLMQGVLYCHEIGIVHRDLKLENILLASKASSSPIKLADFGLATYVKPGQSLNGTVGSPFYIAPEVLSGGYNQAADVWSAGVILYFLLSGVPPFYGKTKSQIFNAVRAADLRFPYDPWDGITESAKKLVRGMLCTDPVQRLTAQQVLDHSWMKDDGLCIEESAHSEKQSGGEWVLGGGSFTALVSQYQDIRFPYGSPSFSDVQSLAVTCRASFSSFIAESLTPSLASREFSFRSSSDGSALNFSTPMSSMPSFEFYSTDPLVEHGSGTLKFSTCISGVNAIREGEVGEEAYVA